MKPLNIFAVLPPHPLNICGSHADSFAKSDTMSLPPSRL